MKKNLFLKVFLFTVIATMVTFTACKDYDDDIDHLQDQITSLKATVDQINSAVSAGAVITDVTSTASGIKVTLSNGKSYDITNGKDGINGVNGVDGKDGSVVEIGENGNWYIDGVDTELPARGPKGETGAPGADGADGKDGINGTDGKDGADGKDGVYYYPNEDGFWYMVDGETETKTEMTWLPAGTITAVYADGVVTLFNVDGTDGPIKLGSVSIAYLTVIPDYVADKGGALPVLNFSPLVTEKCGDIVPATIARFQVSPSNATADMIDTENLTFRYNNPTVRSGIDAKATFKSLKDGVLEVWVEIDTKKAGKDPNKVDQLMLMVPLKTGGQVNSDWMTVSSDPIKDVKLLNVQDKITKGEEANYEFPTTLQGAKDLDIEDLPVVELVYNKTLDLTTVVDTWAADLGAMLNLDTYNLEYVFDLKDEKGKTIVYKLGDNDTDQQQFINLVGSEINTRVYDIDEANPASINRTPIVHVSLMNDDCVVVEGFIKINIIKPEDVEPTPETVEFPVKGKVEADCEPFQLKVGTKEMNENFYAKAKLTKTEFHSRYKWAEATGGVGTIEELKDGADTESYNLVWTLTPAELADNIGKTVEKSGTYTYGGKVFEVTFSAEIIAPQADISSILLTNYWDDGLTYIQHNVQVPQSTTDADPANATFKNNINNAFKTKGLLLDLEAANAKYAGYSYEYFFKSVQKVQQVDGITISVSADGKELLATKGAVTETIAKIIVPVNPDDGDILEYMDDSDLGKYLLNKGPEFMKATLVLKVSKCDGDLDVKLTGKFNGEFDVHFLRPVNVEGESADHFVDGVDVGAKGSILDVRSVVRLSDWRNYAKDTEDYYFDPNHENYYGFYGFTGITIDETKIVPEGLITSGGIELTELPSTIEVNFDSTSTTDNPNGVLTYKNNGAGLINEFTLKVPVSVNYKWGEVETVVRVLVKPTSANKSIM